MFFFQFFCGDGKGGAPNPTQLVPAPAATQAPAQLALPAAAQAVPPPRPRPTAAPPRFQTRSPSRRSKRSLRSQRSRTPSRSAGSRARLTSNVPEPLSGPSGQWQDLSPPQPAQPAQPVQLEHKHPSAGATLAHMAQTIPAAALASPLAGFTLRFILYILWAQGCRLLFSAPAPASFSAPESRSRPAQQGGRPKDLRKPAHPPTEEQASSPADTSSQATPAPAMPKGTSTGAEAQLAKSVDEQFLKDLMSADILDISSQWTISL